MVVGLAALAAAFVVARPAGISGTEAAASLARWPMYGGTLVAGGGVVFCRWVHDGGGSRAERRAVVWWTQVAALIAGGATLLVLATQAWMIAGDVSALTDPRALARTADGRVGVSMVARLLGLVAIAHAVMHVGSRWARRQALAGAVLALASFTWVGHSATARPRLVAVVSDLVHLGAAAVWVGGLVLLGLVLRHRRSQASSPALVVARFSTVAAASVVTLFASGVALTALEIGGLGDLFGHEYGRTVLSKTGLVGAVLAAAAYNRRLVPRLEELGPAGWARLRSMLAVEVAGLVLVLLATSLLVGLATPA